MNYSKKILNLYEDKLNFYNEKVTLENYLDENFFLTDDLVIVLGEDLYIQFLSVINPFFIYKDYEKLKSVCDILKKNIDVIALLKGKTSPSLIFIPNENGNVINSILLKIFNHNNPIDDKIEKLAENLSIKYSNYGYSQNHIYSGKVDGADDLIGANIYELLYKDLLVSRLGFFIGEKDIFISCMQNKKIGRQSYKVKNLLGDIENNNFYEILFKKLLDNYKDKNIIMFNNKNHNSNFYGIFIGNYDEMAKKYGFNDFGESLFIKYK